MTTLKIYVDGQAASLNMHRWGRIQPVIGSGGQNEVIVEYTFAAAVSGTFYGVFRREDDTTEYRVASTVVDSTTRRCYLPADVYKEKGTILVGGVMVSGSNNYTIQYVPVDIFKGFAASDIFAIPESEIPKETVGLKVTQGTLITTQGALVVDDYEPIKSHNHSII